MTQNITSGTGSSSGIRLRRLLLALLGLAGLYLLLTCVAPLDPVVQRNLAHDIDATPLFYTESERLPELEDLLQRSTAGSDSIMQQ